MPGRGDPGGPIDRHPDRVAALESDVAGVEAHPDADPGPVRPRLALERSLAVDGRRDRVARALEHDEEAVALSPTLIATMGHEGGPEQLAVAPEQPGVRVRPDCLLKPARAFDVAE